MNKEKKQLMLLSMILLSILSIFVLRLIHISNSEEAQAWAKMTGAEREAVATTTFRDFLKNQ